MRLAALAAFVHATVLPRQLEPRQNSYVAVKGIVETGTKPRLEIRELEQNADQWNIYLLGLARFQAVDQSEKLSYYQISGLHGRPYIPWDGAEPPAGVSDPGYCRHVSNLFLPWHRPYLALFEQTLYSHIIDAVNSFPAGPQRQKYAAAAVNWRLPYWDWAKAPASGQSVLPSSLTRETVQVTTPNGTQTIHNPLFSYKFHPVRPDDFAYNPFSQWTETYRYPTVWGPGASSQNNLVAQTLDNSRSSFQDRLYNLFTNYNNFTKFSTEAWIDADASNADSLESLHDAIHGITGNSGHMTYLDYSAFDPIFWLHHANIDRLFAMYQAVYPSTYVEPMAQLEQTFATTQGQVMDVNSPLSPFHNSNTSNTYWTSSDVRTISTFGYTYNDLGDGSAASVKKTINSLYGSSSAGTSSGATRFVNLAASSSSATNTDEEGQLYEYLATVSSRKFSLNGSYGIYLFIGDVPNSPSAWALSPNLVGTHAVFAALNSASSDRRAMNPIDVSGTIPLTSKLLDKKHAGELQNMTTEAVTAYLRGNLNWGVAMFDGTEVPPNGAANVTVRVVGAKVQPATASDSFPSWGGFVELGNVTVGKPGGGN
ncbi:Di-copper centre-containing protein [Piedraia hortae CBS 480.64]|uniref:Di-copper centre-containing protein n=1 Tax=Piedraia hortae CBS 480.64 TaxID=1314780 RepID=A0A6A7BQY5_9PEZI|nr:Di-copper centre-containing protein [Piedraia hortae CBS 480.64]